MQHATSAVTPDKSHAKVAVYAAVSQHDKHLLARVPFVLASSMHAASLGQSSGLLALTWFLASFLLNFALQVLKTPVSRDMLGRIFNGSGRPIDGG